MKKVLKRPLSILLAVLMVMSVFIAVPMTASALTGNDVDSLLLSMEAMIDGYMDQQDWDHAGPLIEYHNQLVDALNEANGEVTPVVESRYNAAYTYFTENGGTVSGGQGGSGGSYPDVNNVYMATDRIVEVTVSDLERGDVIVKSPEPMEIQKGDCSIVLVGGTYGDGDMREGTLSQTYTDDVKLDNEVRFEFMDDARITNMDNYERYVPVYNNALGNAYIVLGNDNGTVYLAGYNYTTYTITWKDYNGSNLYDGQSTVAPGAVPYYRWNVSRSSTAQYSYTFTGWTDSSNNFYSKDSDLPAATKDETYTATYSQTLRSYTITWKDGDNKTLKSDSVAYGTTPSYTGATPTKTEDDDYTYEFNYTWSPSVASVTGNATYTAQFTAVPKSDPAHTEHTYVNNPTFNWSQDASTGDWNCNKLTLTCSGCDATQDYEVAGFFGTSAVTVTANNDGSFTYSVSKKVDGVTYSDTKTYDANRVVKSSKQLTAAAKKGGSWELGADIDGAVNVVCANGFVLDGKGHTVTRNASVSTQAVFRTTTNPAEVTIKNLTIDGIAGQKDLQPAIATKMSNPSAGNVFNLENVTITNYDFDQANNGVVLAWGQATVNMTNCDVVTDSTYDVWGGAASKVNISGGSVGTAYLNGGSAQAEITNGATVNSIVALNGNTIKTDNPANINVPADSKLKDNDDGTYSIVAKDYVAQIEGGAKFETLADAFAAAQDGDTITVLADCAGDGIKVTPAGKFNDNGLTVDFNGHTYTVDGETVGSTGTETNGFQLLKNNNVTFKNGTITSTKAKILVQNYSNLELSNMTLTLDNPNYTQAYTLSDNNGVVTINDTTINANPAGGFAFDVCRFSSYPSVTVIVTGDSEINGDVEVFASKSDPKSGFTLSLQSGTLNGDIVIDPTAQAAMEKSDASGIAKTESFAQAAPEGYMWTDAGEGMQKLAAIPKDDVLTPVMAKKDDGNQFGLGDLEYHFGTLLGVQKKNALPGADKTSEKEAQENGNDLRFVAVLQTDILRNAQDYGFVLAKVDSSRTTESVAQNINALSADGVGNGEKVISARGSSNNVCGNDAYGDPSADTSYKYITCAVNGVEDGTKVVARFYVKIGGKTYYAQYPQGGSYTGNFTAAVAGINNGSIY